jgi:hypothetical protein
MRIEKIENIHFVIIAVTTFCVFGLTLFVLFDMDAHQKQRIGYLNVLVVTFAWLDYVGDLTWTWQRFHAYFVRGEEEQNLDFGIISAVILALSTMITSYNVFVRILLRRKTSIKREKITSFAFITLLLISFTEPDVIMFFPWKEDSYKLELDSAFPNEDCIIVSLMRLWEDIPEFILQVAYLVSGNFDAFTVLNLGLTFISLVYMVMGKLLVLVLDPGNDDSKDVQGSIELNDIKKVESKPRNIIEVIKDVKKVFRETLQLDKELPLADLLEKAHEILSVPNWDSFHNTREKILGVAKEMDIPTETTNDSDLRMIAHSPLMVPPREDGNRRGASRHIFLDRFSESI